jgi:hypothetical protein
LRFSDQFEAYQPSGNGMNGQTIWLSFAAFGDSWAKVLISGTNGVERTAKRRHAHCKFIVVAPVSQFLFRNSVSSRNPRLQNCRGSKNGTLILKSRMHSRKIGGGFQPAPLLHQDK